MQPAALTTSERNLFFWERDRVAKGRSRFNLLLLEYGEYFLEDKGVHLVPIPNDGSDSSLEKSEAMKLQGRIKMCSRSLVFEPQDLKKPLIKFPFKSMTTNVESFSRLYARNYRTLVDISRYFTFECTNYFEMKSDSIIGPYKFVEFPEKPCKVVFSLTHSDLDSFLGKVTVLKTQFSLEDKKGFPSGSQSACALEYSAVSIFDRSLMVDFHEELLMQHPVSVKKVSPLVLNPGGLMITSQRVYFQPAQLNNVGDKVTHFELRIIQRMYRRRYLLMNTGLEFILNDGRSFLFIFDTSERRNSVHSTISEQPHLVAASPSLEDICRMWQRREISNAEYLMYINNEAGRSINDLTQYPVFPHVIADYTSKSLKLDNRATFRDLTKPVGALDQKRLDYFLERFNSMTPGDPENGIPPPFMYGTHYSTPGYVLYYLVRVAPEHLLNLQNGKFDAPDRMFFSITENWKSCLTNPADLKELIPEFFMSSGEFLLNSEDLDLGQRQTGERLHDVELPMWAKNQRDFIRKNAKALESDYVSEHLHHWIDLIFGYKQQGEEAIKANNVFYYLTYAGAVNLENARSDHERAALEAQIQEFGQTPLQIFSTPHPCRNDDPTLPIEFVISDVDKEKLLPPSHGSDGGEKLSSLTLDESEAESNSMSAICSVGDTDGLALGGSQKPKVSLFESWTDKTMSFLDRTLGGGFSSKQEKSEKQSTGLTSVAASTASTAASSTKLTLKPLTDLIDLFNSEITSICYDRDSHSLCVCARDGQAKVIDFNVEQFLAETKKLTSSDPRIRSCVILRNEEGHAFSGCHFISSSKNIALSSWDNSIYYYSSLGAGKLLGSVIAHADAVSSISLDSKRSYVASGSFDSTVKLWRCNGEKIHQLNAFEFLGNSSSVNAVSLSSYNGKSDPYPEFIASGSEDGAVHVWKVKDQQLLFRHQASPERMAVSCLRWVTLAGAHYCLVGTNDGILLSLDINGDINASKYLGVANAVRSIDITNNFLLCSLDDKSVRGWIFDPVGGKLIDALNMSSFHGSTGISALCTIPIAKSKSFVLITGGDMGQLRISVISGLD